MARPRKRRRRRSRGGGRFLSLYLVLAVVVTAVVIGAGCIVFFKVNQFEVEGNQRYSTEEIAKASGVSKGDNLFLVNKTETARKLLDELAYVRSVNIKRKLPDTLVITVAETNAAAAIQSGKEWWLVNEEGKVLDTTKKPKEFIQITGLELVSPEAGQSMKVKSEDKPMRDSLLRLLKAMKGRELLEDVRSVDCTDSKLLVMDYRGQLTVKILADADFDYQVKMLEAVLEKYVDVTWSKDDKGTLDMTYADGHPHLTKNKKSLQQEGNVGKIEQEILRNLLTCSLFQFTIIRYIHFA